jgi:hypothetical protein
MRVVEHSRRGRIIKRMSKEELDLLYPHPLTWALEERARRLSPFSTRYRETMRELWENVVRGDNKEGEII